MKEQQELAKSVSVVQILGRKHFRGRDLMYIENRRKFVQPKIANDKNVEVQRGNFRN